MPPEMKDDHPPHGQQGNDGAAGAAVECRDLQFSYPQRPLEKVLKGVSIKVFLTKNHQPLIHL